MQPSDLEWLLEVDRTDHISAHQIERFRTHRLSAEERLAIGRHLAVCAICNDLYSMTHRKRRPDDTQWSPAQLQWIRQNFGLEASTRRDHLDYEWLVELAAGQLDPLTRKIWKMHFQLCPNCREELRDFLTFIRTEDSLDL